MQAHLLQRRRHWCSPSMHSLYGGFHKLRSTAGSTWVLQADLQRPCAAFLWAHQASNHPPGLEMTCGLG